MENPRDRRTKKRFTLTDAEFTDVLQKEDRVTISMKDISESGLRFSAPREIPKDTVVSITVNFFPVYFPIRAAVVWTKPGENDEFEHGAEFINVPPEERALISAYLRGLGTRS